MAESSKSKPVRLLASVAAGSTVLAGGLPLLTPAQYDWIGPAAGLLGLVITAGLAVYTEQSVTPNDAVAARALPSGDVVAGDASPVKTGAPVDVTPVADTQWGA